MTQSLDDLLAAIDKQHGHADDLRCVKAPIECRLGDLAPLLDAMAQGPGRVVAGGYIPDPGRQAARKIVLIMRAVIGADMEALRKRLVALCDEGGPVAAAWASYVLTREDFGKWAPEAMVARMAQPRDEVRVGIFRALTSEFYYLHHYRKSSVALASAGAPAPKVHGARVIGQVVATEDASVDLSVLEGLLLAGLRDARTREECATALTELALLQPLPPALVAGLVQCVSAASLLKKPKKDDKCNTAVFTAFAAGARCRELHAPMLEASEGWLELAWAPPKDGKSRSALFKSLIEALTALAKHGAFHAKLLDAVASWLGAPPAKCEYQVASLAHAVLEHHPEPSVLVEHVVPWLERTRERNQYVCAAAEAGLLAYASQSEPRQLAVRAALATAPDGPCKTRLERATRPKHPEQ